MLVRPTPLYDAVAGALVGVGGDRPLLIRQVVEAVEGVLSAAAAEAVSGRDPAAVRIAQMTAEMEAQSAQHKIELARLKRDATYWRKLAEEHAANAASAAREWAERMAVLEAVYVQAKNRWDVEGGPDVLRDVLKAVG